MRAAGRAEGIVISSNAVSKAISAIYPVCRPTRQSAF
jgi:hypothetical protein